MEYQIYKSKYTGKHVDDAIDQIPNKLDKQTAQTESDQVYGKLADGSQTMFDVTMGATATTIPRRDTAGRIQVADGVSGNDAVNFNQLSIVESSVSGLNIQNGSGTKAIQQKQDGTTGTFDFTGKNPNATALDPTLTGQIAYGATGDFAVSFGGKSAAQGKRSVSVGTTTIAKGKYSAAFGDNSVALGNESFVANSVTTASGQGASAFGNSTIASGYNSFAEGNSTIASGQVSHAAGTGTKATSNNQFVIGKYNAEDDNAIFIIGIGTDENHRINGFLVNKNGVAYSNGLQLATNEYVDNSAEFLKLSIKDSVITQKLNVGRSDNNNVVSQGASAAIGVGLNTNAYAQTVLGRYNKPDADAFFIVGNGTPDNIQNAFEVLNDGRAKVQTAPKDANDVVIKQYADDNFVKINKPIEGTYAYVCSKDNYSTVYKIAVKPEAWTIPGRKDDGRIEVGYPVDNSDATTKSYVDTQINSSTTMYRHSISYLGTSDEGVTVKIYLTVVSRTSLVVDSLSALKVLIGNTFTYSATGAVLKTLQQELYQVVAITDTQVKTIFNSGFIDIDYPTGKWSDDVTTV